MAAKNDITGDTIATRQITDSYRDNFDRIFRQKKDKQDEPAHDTVRPAEPTNSNEQPKTPD